MKNEKVIRDTLLMFLKGGQAYSPFSEIIANFPEAHMNDIFPNGTYTPWHLLEHIRRTQFDILDFIINSDYQERSWPDDYWPAKSEKATQKEWDKTISDYEKDRQALEKIIKDPKTDLYAKIPHGSGQTILKEIILIVDHASYHLGEFSIMRQVMNTWNKK
ncbi:MAG TPA: DinB family protein [Candidatus Saccharimonadales bacterium]|nr:DinB family protein [Candidatus Saccharimonadales bacterium]